jgi:hypothetical protein
MHIERNIKKYLDGTSASDGRKPDARYSSFDYCFNYVQSFHEKGACVALADPEHIQLSCLQLGFYLASWGMLRGSAKLLQKSARHLAPIVAAIARTDASLWTIDAHCYTEAHIQQLVDAAGTIGHSQPDMSDILVTKIMLGVFGNVPAFDTYFKKGLGVSGFSANGLRKIGAFYQAHSTLIDRYRRPTLEFVSGKPTKRVYTRAKVIDMVFFVEGMP